MEKILNEIDNISETLQRTRINKGLNYIELSELCSNQGIKINSRTLEKIEKGIIIPKLEQLIAILFSLNISIKIN